MEQPQLGGKAASLSRSALRDGVYQIILDMLLEGRVEPGAPLGIDSLARQLDVSPTPVREALVQLEHTGLVRRAALKGYRVAPPLDAEQMRELFDARSVLEVSAARWALADVDALVPDLRAAHEAHQRAAEKFRTIESDQLLAGYRNYFDADWGFHEAILAHCGNRFLLQMAQSTSTHTHRLRQSASHGLTDMDQALAEHLAVLEAFEAGDGDAASEAMRTHIGNVRDRALQDTD